MQKHRSNFMPNKLKSTVHQKWNEIKLRQKRVLHTDSTIKFLFIYLFIGSRDMQIFNALFIFKFYLYFLIVFLYVFWYFLILSFHFICFAIVFIFSVLLTPHPAPRPFVFGKTQIRQKKNRNLRGLVPS